MPQYMPLRNLISSALGFAPDVIHKCAFSWPTNLINVQWANFSYFIMILSIFSHGSEKKLVGVLRGLTNQPYVRRSTCDTPLLKITNNIVCCQWTYLAASECEIKFQT